MSIEPRKIGTYTVVDIMTGQTYRHERHTNSIHGIVGEKSGPYFVSGVGTHSIAVLKNRILKKILETSEVGVVSSMSTMVVVGSLVSFNPDPDKLYLVVSVDDNPDLPANIKDLVEAGKVEFVQYANRI